jgi:hypothetical protein
MNEYFTKSMKVVLVISFLCFFGTLILVFLPTKTTATSKQKSVHAAKIEYLQSDHHIIIRVENDEIICYQSNVAGGLSCQWKAVCHD